MSDCEILDVVDASDRVVGQAARSEVHARGFRHRAVHVLVFNRDGALFLQKRSRAKDTFPGAWDSSAAGHLEAGEDYDAAAVRELEEELGVRPAVPPRRLFKIDARPETDSEFVWVYRADCDEPLRLNRDEIERGAWCTPESVDRWCAERPGVFASAFPLLWRIFRGGGAGVLRH